MSILLDGWWTRVPKSLSLPIAHIPVYLVGIGVALFLNLFQPFGINNDDYSLSGMIMVSGYGLVSAGCFLIAKKAYECWRPTLVSKIILFWTLFIWLLIIANYSYFVLIFSQSFHFISLVEIGCNVILVTLLVGLLIAKYRPSSSAEILISSQNKGELPLRIKPDHLILIKGAGNYVEIYFRSDAGLKKVLIRSSLKEIYKDLQFHPSFIRVHLSYIVNVSKILQIEKSGRSRRLHLSDASITVPVSEKYFSDLVQIYP